MEKNVEVKIADEVVAVVAGLAATDVKGVVCLSGNLTREIIAKQSTRSLSRGITLNIKNKEVAITLSIVIAQGYNVKDVSVKVQEKVKNSVESMTGFNVSTVTIHIAGIE